MQNRHVPKSRVPKSRVSKSPSPQKTLWTAYAYDENGNNTLCETYELRSENGVTSEKSIDYLVMTYDSINRMTKAEKEGMTAEYTYGADNMRRSKTVNGVETKHLWDGGNIAGETDADGNIQAKYYRGNGLIAADMGSGLSYYQADNHGDIKRIGNTSYAYDAFGNQQSENADDTNPFRYCGEYFDEETGFIYLRNRYYNSANGRFISEDPVKDGLNWYVYCEDNPVMFVDPWGLVGISRYILGNAVRLRSNPGVNSAVYELLEKNTEVSYNGNKTGVIDGHKWAEVKYNEIIGWVAADYLGTEPSGGFVGPKQFVGPINTDAIKKPMLTGSLQFGTGIMAKFKLFGAGVEVGGKRYYEFSPDSDATENMQFSLMGQISDSAQIGASFTGTMDATTKEHLKNSGFAGIKVGNIVLGWGDIPNDKDINISIELEAYVGVGVGGSASINLSEAWRRIFK